MSDLLEIVGLVVIGYLACGLGYSIGRTFHGLLRGLEWPWREVTPVSISLFMWMIPLWGFFLYIDICAARQDR